MLKKIATWAVIIFIAFYVLSQPAGAAHAARSGLKGAGTSLSTFVNGLGG